MAERRRRREVPDVEGTPVERGVGPSREETTVTVPEARQDVEHTEHLTETLTPARLAGRLPAPHEPVSDSPTLTPDERTELARCERALRIGDSWFWVRGRVLQTIRDARLYRETHSTFEDYCAEVWEMTARRANQLIEAWPLAEYLMLILGTIVPKININEGQVRQLLPLAKRHGNDAAVLIYETIARADVRVTAAVLQAAIAVLPVDRFDRDEVLKLLEEFLTADSRALPSPAQRSTTPSDIFTTEARRLDTIARRVVTHAKEDPEAARKFAAMLDEMAARIRAELE